MTNNYYVYVYIDPRNFEEFYYGKGKGSRKDAHLSDSSDSEKVKRIAAIRKAGLDPIIRVIASRLTEDEAFLIEKTLLWRLGKQLTNISSGNFSDKFRPHDTLHQKISGFDYQTGVYYYNVGECKSRNWDDYKTFGFISGGGGQRWKDAMQSFNQGDVIVAYLKGHGFVGVGVLLDEAKPIREAKVNDSLLEGQQLICPSIFTNSNSDELCEYVAPVRWHAAVDRGDARWISKSGLYTTTHVRASLDGQPDTITFIEKEFNVNLRALSE